MDSVEVLNGTIKVGDRVAVAIGAGRYGSGMRLGTVLEIPDDEHVKVQVEKCSTGPYSWQKFPYVKTYDMPRRIVKLALAPKPGDEAKALLGQQVTVTLDRPDHMPAVVTEGELLGFGEDGTAEVREDDGFVHYCWPALDIRARVAL